MEPKDFQKVIDSFKVPEGVTTKLAGGRMWNMTQGKNPGLIVSVDFTDEIVYYHDSDNNLVLAVWDHIRKETGKEFEPWPFRT
jgi:hypothetical protein